MKLHRTCQLDRLVRHEESLLTARYELGQVMLEKRADGARLVVTNGRGLAIVPVEDADDDSPGFIPAAAIRAATSLPCDDDDGQLLSTRIDAGESVRVAMDGVISEYKRVDSGRPFPRVDGVFPDGDPVMRVKLDPAFLVAISDALGAEAGVELEIRSGLKPIVVNPLQDRGIAGRVGLLMPIDPGDDCSIKPSSSFDQARSTLQAARDLLVDVNVEELEHDKDDCPQDDTCDCANVERLNSVLRDIDKALEEVF